MTSFKTIGKTAAALSLTVLAASFAYAQDSARESGSTDIWSTDFQKTLTTGNVVHNAQGSPTSVGSIDIWGTDFQKVLGTHQATRGTPDTTVVSGSIDIYTTDFEKAYM
jgi:hypothetical protein